MSRLSLTFECQNSTLAGTLDTAPGSTGLLIVSGGNEIRSGAFSGQAHLAQAVCKAGFPVFRFDRRGIGDSDGENRGFRKSRKDIVAAIEAFRAMCPQMNRVVAFGNCDAASALMLAKGEGCDALILSNPWTIEDDSGDLTPEATRSRYAEKLKNPREILRLLTGKVNLSKLANGLKQALQPKAKPTSLSQDMADGLAASQIPAVFFLAGEDRTAQIFESHWQQKLDDYQVRRCQAAGHSYAEPQAREWLEREVLAVLRG